MKKTMVAAVVVFSLVLANLLLIHEMESVDHYIRQIFHENAEWIFLSRKK